MKVTVSSVRPGWASRALAALAVAVCLPAWAGTLQGTAAYRERIALPPDAVFEAVLLDVSRADAAASVLGRAKIDPAGQPPFRFEIAYDDALVQPRRRYVVRATISHRDRLLFTTDRAYPALDGRTTPLQLLLMSARGPRSVAGTDGIGPLPASYAGELSGPDGLIAWHLDLLPAGRYQLRATHVGKPEPNRFDDIGRWTRERDTGWIVLRGERESPILLAPEDGGTALRMHDAAGKPRTPGPNDRLRRQPKPAPIEPRLALTGMFSYMADAASITLCADGQRLPVAMDADYRALETAYLQARPRPGQPVLASLEGLIAPRPAMETRRPPQTTVVVERFIGVWPRESCGNPLADSPLRGIYWKLVRLGGSPVPAPENQREAHLVFAVQESRISGSGGCNRLNGDFELDGDQLRLRRMAGTMMACPTGMDLERRLLESLEKVEGWRIRGSHLEMLDGAGAVVARLEAVAQP
jgi:copper homeostasis protein (lipoprotein)